MTETEITLRALTARSRLSPEERRKLEQDADAFAARHGLNEGDRLTFGDAIELYGFAEAARMMLREQRRARRDQ